ncbi:iron-sulfur cluster-binding domain-containing protein [Paraflavitalea sp. CAU 1676]|uniref:flavin reductase family protein n=1 Tax=Paraflavitalea sp. CAU 1676 TaxID=3032598 RepID=UPI0023DC1C9C|nr:iron-sulfur cluster-binding domain-containing protein [Paraflavitalea sp. CAU 1676]MDF2192848.1 iron-sulfur cluster-binding domain-containing protein [Paraflavitalea sp. CAU 1676]
MELLQWKVVRVIPEAKNTISYVLEPLGEQAVTYQAGQFLTFLFNVHGQEVRRSFSLGSTPGIDPQVFITVKKKENGALSRYILEHWQVDTVVDTLPATGRFTLDTDAAFERQVFFIAAGSGITPVYALLKKLLNEEPHSRAVLLYQNHDENTIIYHEALQALKKSFGNRFTRIDLLSYPILHKIPHQRLSNGLFEILIHQYLQPGLHPTLYYTCGPAPFMRMVQFTLRVTGVPEAFIRKENFTVDTLPPPAFTIDAAPRKVQVRQGARIHEFEVSYPDTILQAAQHHHIHLPYSCKGGRCGACTAHCISGTVKMNMNEVLTENDLQKGLILTCVGYALTDLTLEL